MNYTYVNSQIKVIEQKILGRNEFLKLSKVENNEFIKTLVDLGYGKLNDSLEKIINHELASVKSYLDEVSPKRDITNLFFLSNDAINIKYLYKVKNFNIKDLGLFLNTGVFSRQVLEEVILHDDYTNLSKVYVRLFKDIKAKVENETNPRILSAKVDSEIFAYILGNLKFQFNSALNTYYKSQIDFSNILSFIRMKKLGWDLEENSFMFNDGGSFDIKSFFKANDNEIVKGLQEFYNEKLSKVLKLYFEDLDLNKLELRLDNLQLEIMKEFENDSFGIGPILYYYLKKQAEAKNIRLLYANKEQDLLLAY